MGEEHLQVQQMLDQYDSILDSLRDEYEEDSKEGMQLPAFGGLIRTFQIEG